MARIGVFTMDFKFYHDVIQLLKQWQLPFVSLESPENVPPDVSVILSSSRDEVSLTNQIKSEKPEDALRKSLCTFVSKDSFESLVIGIDPGPYPGVAVFADNILTEAYECPILDKLGAEIHSIINSYMYKDLEIKVGNGDAPNRDNIIKTLKDLHLKITVVDEKNTSFPHKIHDNALSAARIAQIDKMYRISENAISNQRRKTAYEREFTTLKSIIS